MFDSIIQTKFCNQTKSFLLKILSNGFTWDSTVSKNIGENFRQTIFPRFRSIEQFFVMKLLIHVQTIPLNGPFHVSNRLHSFSQSNNWIELEFIGKNQNNPQNEQFCKMQNFWKVKNKWKLDSTFRSVTAMIFNWMQINVNRHVFFVNKMSPPPMLRRCL